jgi:hypothetical protein
MINIYEKAQLEEFERSILSGYVSKQKLEHMWKHEVLSEGQIRIIQELGEAVGANIPQGGQQPLPVGNTPPPAPNPERFQNTQMQQWKDISSTIKQSQILEKFQKLKQLFPQDKFINQIADYFSNSLVELENYLKKNHSHTSGGQAPQQQTAPAQNGPPRAPQQQAPQQSYRH